MVSVAVGGTAMRPSCTPDDEPTDRIQGAPRRLQFRKRNNWGGGRRGGACAATESGRWYRT